MDETSHKKLNKFLDEVFTKYDLEDNPFFIGGHHWVAWTIADGQELINWMTEQEDK